jgi:hypothetical protein
MTALTGRALFNERAALHDLLDELEEADYKTSTVEEFRAVGESMIAAGMTDIADKLRGLKAAIAGEYGD